MSLHTTVETAPPKLSRLGRAALAYAERFGWAVHPLKPGAKTPLTAHGFKDATTDLEQIRAWWTEHPTANIGIATGKESGVSVFDVDVKDGAGGDLALRALLEQHGGDLTEHVCQRTWSGGLQYFFAYDPRARQGAGCYGKGLDGRNDGGYVVAPPSIVNGKTYEWIVRPGSQLEMPGWLIEVAEQVKPTPAEGERKNPIGWADELMQEGRPLGQRDEAAWRLICFARETGKSEAECLAMLKLFGSHCEPAFDPETDPKIMPKIRRAYRKPPVFESSVPKPVRTPVTERTHRLVTQDGPAITIRRIDWLWPGRLARGVPTLLIGDPDLGKGLTLADIVARVTTGRPWPDESADTPLRQPGHVIILSAEDPADTVLKPRLEAAGADPAYYTVVHGVLGADDEERGLSLEVDTAELAALVTEKRTVLLIVDPLNAYLGQTDTNTDNKVRSSLKPLVRLLEQHNLAAVALMHMGKDSDRAALYRSLGSIGFTAAARASFCLARDPAEPESLRRLFLQVKFNIGPKPPGLVLQVEPATVPHPDGGEPVSTAKVAWLPETTIVTANEALGRWKSIVGREEEAEGFLRDLLESGPVLVEQLKSEAKARKVSRRMLEQAKKALGVKYRRQGGMVGPWECYLGSDPAVVDNGESAAPARCLPPTSLDTLSGGQREYQLLTDGGSGRQRPSPPLSGTGCTAGSDAPGATSEAPPAATFCPVCHLFRCQCKGAA